MAILNIDTYKLDFLILDSNDNKTIVILDRSNYLDVPEKPIVEVTLPGFTGRVELTYNINGLTVLDSDSLCLTQTCEYSNLADLPDGVYQIKIKVCPYDKLFFKKCYIKTTFLENLFADAVLSLDNFCEDELPKLKENLIDIDILIKGAKAETAYCNVENGIKKYIAAFKSLEKLINKLNCK